MNDAPKRPFQPMPLTRRQLPKAALERYRIYSDAGNFKVVEAASAKEALAASGLQKAFRITRDAVLTNVINLQSLPKEEAAAPVAEKPVVAEAAPPTAPAAEPVAEPTVPAAPLSNEDVSKLLQEAPPANP